MADTFEELGIASVLAEGAAALGWEGPSGLQRDALPVIRRGNNVVLHASAGAGTTGAYGLGVLDRLVNADGEPGGSPRALILVPSDDDASHAAGELARLGAGAGVTVGALAAGWPPRAADLIVASAAAAVAGIRDSSLKVDDLLALVVDGADLLADMDQWDALETVLETTPSDAQRVLVAGRLDETIDGLAERHVRKAMTIPPRPTDVAATTQATGPEVAYSVATDTAKTAAVVALIAGGDAPDVAVICRDTARANRLSADLAARGVTALVLPRLEADRRSTRAEVVSYDVPFDAETLAELHARGGTVLVTPAQRPHLDRIARRVGATLRPLPALAPRPAGAVEAVRARLRATALGTDLAADLALIEPLLEEFTAAELAAAALHMARSAAAAPTPTAQARLETTSADTARARTAPAAPPPSTAWVRLFVSAGTRDGLGPGDLVGAITGETGLAGEQVGKIEVRESHSTVEVPGSAAESVIKALNGRSLRGRSLRVDYDRKERTQRRTPGGRPPGRGGPRPGGPRVGGRGGPRSGPRG